jgi:HAD superfamily hydrolase (TIGR01549 family)
MDELFEELWELFARGEPWKLADQAVQTLTTLKDKNYRLAVLSNNDSRLRSVLRELQVDHLFEHLFISSELGFEKPQIEIFHAVEETLEVTPQEIMHLGDSYSRDYLGAQESGWNPVLYGSDSQAKVHIQKFPELLNLLS